MVCEREGTGDWKSLNNSKDHWGRLPVSNEKGHEIKLVVLDGMKEDSFVEYSKQTNAR